MSLKEDEPKETLLINMAKVKEIILKAAGEKQRLTYKGTPSWGEGTQLGYQMTVQ